MCADRAIALLSIVTPVLTFNRELNIFTSVQGTAVGLGKREAEPGKFTSEQVQRLSFSHGRGEVVPEGDGPDEEGVLVVVGRCERSEETVLMVVTCPGLCRL